jgi:ribonuclease HIII
MPPIPLCSRSAPCQNSPVPQETLVVKVPQPERAALRERLSASTFEFRSVPHALFSVKGEGVVATLYESGKLVVQGADPAFFVERFVGGACQPAPSKSSATEPARLPEETAVGSDEAGKGDYFGPLVVCAVRVEVDQAPGLVAAGVTDSKRLADGRALKLGAWLREELPHSLQVLMPADYGRAWDQHGLHRLLSDMHAAAIREVARPGDRAVIDQFSKRDEIGPQLRDLKLRIERRPRAESEVAVAAASILARAEFLIGLRELGEEYDFALPKGAGSPVDEAGAEFARRLGLDRLAAVAKVHFKNTEKIRARLEAGGPL